MLRWLFIRRTGPLSHSCCEAKTKVCLFSLDRVKWKKLGYNVFRRASGKYYQAVLFTVSVVATECSQNYCNLSKCFLSIVIFCVFVLTLWLFYHVIIGIVHPKNPNTHPHVVQNWPPFFGTTFYVSFFLNHTNASHIFSSNEKQFWTPLMCFYCIDLHVQVS